MPAPRREIATTRAATISVVSNTVLVVFKLVVGLMIGSVAVISEAVHSAMDLVAAGIALFAVRAAARPADEHHLYGHGRSRTSRHHRGSAYFRAAAYIIYGLCVSS